jgi:pyrroloquinoline-quinone synthase
MYVANRAPRVLEYASQHLKDVRILDNTYLRALTDGTMSLDCFRKSQEQFFFAVTFFPRPMAALVGRIDDPKLRIDILHNLVEEHGEFNEELYHANTFQRFLRSIGSAKDPEAAECWPALRAFNNVLTSACLLDELEVGVGCMGIIEFAFADISAVIGKAVVARGWVSETQLVHYKLHAEIDTRHADEFFAVVEPRWDDPRRRYYIKQGLELGAYVFKRLYEDMYVMGNKG